MLVAPSTALSAEQKLNNLVSQLLEVSTSTNASLSFSFNRARDGWVFIRWKADGKATLRLVLDSNDSVVSDRSEAMRYVLKGEHTLR